MADINTVASDYLGRVSTRIRVKTQPKSISKDDEASCFEEAVNIIASITEIIDTDDDFGYLIVFKNVGDNPITYKEFSAGPDIQIAPNGELDFGYDDSQPDEVPLFQLDPFSLYSIEADGVALSSQSFLNAQDAAVQLALFTKQFALDWIQSYSSANVNINNKNLLVSVQDVTVRASITQIQVKDTTTNTTVYDGLSELSSDVFDVLTALTPGDNHKVLIASNNTNLQIAITAGNIPGVLYKTKEFLSTDPDNNLTAPIRINIYPVS